jgi:hypothetical protein
VTRTQGGSWCYFVDARLGRQLPGNQVSQQLEGIGSNGLHDCHELDDVNATLAALILGDKGLRPPYAACEFILGQAGLLTSSHHQSAKRNLV